MNIESIRIYYLTLTLLDFLCCSSSNSSLCAERLYSLSLGAGECERPRDRALFDDSPFTEDLLDLPRAEWKKKMKQLDVDVSPPASAIHLNQFKY